MPRFFFDLNSTEKILDEEGSLLSGIDAAKDRAIIEAREMACVDIAEGQLDLRHRIDVRDERGATVAVVWFGDAVTVICRED